MRKAEMELKKGQNMIEHEAEIFSRPARTWFQTSKEKQKAGGLSLIIVSPGQTVVIIYIPSDLSKLVHENGGKLSKMKVLDENKVSFHYDLVVFHPHDMRHSLRETSFPDYLVKPRGER